MQLSEDGYYGDFGGAYVPEMLRPALEELSLGFAEVRDCPAFRAEYHRLLRDYTGRPTPLYRSRSLSSRYGCEVYLKREDLNHTGSHKITNSLGQVLLAERLGKRRVIAETGAGQHGVAVATASALRGLPCVIFMGRRDVERQRPNVERMELLGATVRAVTGGSATLKDATTEAIREWLGRPEDTAYVIGSTVGPHPYPGIVAHFQGIIGGETAEQCASRGLGPTHVVACVGGGSNSIGIFSAFLDRPEVALIGAEGGGTGERSAATLTLGRPGVFHGSRSIVLQDEDGQICEAHSISAGLDYPGVGPQHAALAASGRVRYVAVSDEQALAAGVALAREEGILPALESAHALAALEKVPLDPRSVVVVNLSGRGDKDCATYGSRLAQGREQCN